MFVCVGVSGCVLLLHFHKLHYGWLNELEQHPIQFIACRRHINNIICDQYSQMIQTFEPSITIHLYICMANGGWLNNSFALPVSCCLLKLFACFMSLACENDQCQTQESFDFKI